MKIRDEIDLAFGPPLSVISDCIRGFIKAKEGYEFIACDFSAIEARVVAWLAGEQKVLDIFKTHGKIYEHAAAGIYRVSIDDIKKDDPRRQIGKVAVLALGFAGGVGAFQQMARGYGVRVSDAQADDIKNKWREANPKIVKFWRDLEEAAKSAIINPGQVSVGPIKFKKSGSFLWCKLPSGRVLCYPYPKIEEVEMPWGGPKESITYMAEDSFSKKFERTKTYGGSLCENVTQAVAACLLRAAMVRLENRGYPIVMHIHDEVVCELPIGQGSVKEMEMIMSESPEWAEGLPLACEGWQGKRFRK